MAKIVDDALLELNKQIKDLIEHKVNFFISGIDLSYGLFESYCCFHYFESGSGC